MSAHTTNHLHAKVWPALNFQCRFTTACNTVLEGVLGHHAEVQHGHAE